MNKILTCIRCFAAVGCVLALASCSDEPDAVKTAQMKIDLVMPSGLADAEASNLVLTLKDLSTGQSTEVPPQPTRSDDPASTFDGQTVTLTMAEGLYNISIDGDITYTVDGDTQKSQLRGVAENVTVSGATSATPIAINTYLYNPGTTGNGFVLAELFYGMTLTPEGKQYAGDSYFVIYNNSSETLYADGLVIAESTFQSDVKEDYRPNIIDEAVTIQAAYRIPGTGRDVPVLPGESLLIADAAIDHRTANPNSFDLSKADFEWFDESSDPDYSDIDTDAPNLESIFRTSLSVWTPHMRGVKSYILCYLGGDPENPMAMSAQQYLEDYHYVYTYDFIWDGEVYPMGDYDGYKIPNSWVVDCVNTACLDEVMWMVSSPTLDRGYTYTRETSDDKTSYGQCVRRKLLSGTILQDTNDSSHDFLPKQKADPYYKFHE